MKHFYVSLGAVWLVSACTEVIDQRESSIVVDGVTLPVVTNTVRSGNRTYDVSYVTAKYTKRQCNLNLTGDCEAAARESRRSNDD